MTLILDNLTEKEPKNRRRSYKWHKVRNEFLKKFPRCAVCNSKFYVEAHHIVPFHVDPDKELDEKNLITLCENKQRGVNCHLFFGHLGNYKSYNENVISDAQAWRDKLMDRPITNLGVKK